MLQARIPSGLTCELQAIMEEYREEVVVSQGSEESEEREEQQNELMRAGIRYPPFPSQQLLEAIDRNIEVCAGLSTSCVCVCIALWLSGACMLP